MNKRKNKYNYRESQLIIPKIRNLNINSQQINHQFNNNNNNKIFENKNPFNDNPLCHKVIIKPSKTNLYGIEFFFISNKIKKEDIFYEINLLNKNNDYKKIKSKSLIHYEIKIDKNKVNKKEPKYKFDSNLLFSLETLIPIKTIKENTGSIESLDVFPSGNFVAVSVENDILIYNTNFHLIQSIKNNDNSEYGTTCVYVIDNKFFLTCSKHIKFWKLNNNNIYYNTYKIENPHQGRRIYSIKFYNKGNNIVSCALDHYIKFYSKNNNNTFSYINQIEIEGTLTFVEINEKRNILINGSYNGIYLIDLNKYTIIDSCDNIKCMYQYSYTILSENKFITGGVINGKISVVDISTNKINEETMITFGETIWSILYLKEKDIIIVVSDRMTMKIYENITFKEIYQALEIHKNRVTGIVQLYKEIITTFSEDGTIKIWYINYKDKINKKNEENNYKIKD